MIMEPANETTVKPAESAAAEATTPQSPKPLRVVNRRARLAFAGAMVAELFFILSALVPYGISLVLSSISALLAVAALIVGFTALRKRPRNLAVAAIVFSGVLVIIYAIMAALLISLPALLNQSAN